jgi:protein SFI1
VLVRAIVRVWRAHERGKLLERVRDSRVIQQMWYLWQQRLLEHRRQEQFAISFALRPGSALAASTFKAWKRANKTHQDSLQIAAQYHTVQIQHKAMLTWRIQLRRHTKLAKQARTAEKHLILRSAWVKWRHVIEERARQGKLQAFQRQKTRKIFDSE